MESDTFVLVSMTALVMIIQGALIKDTWGNWKKVSLHLLTALFQVTIMVIAVKY
jgi:hypothetical protein